MTRVGLGAAIASFLLAPYRRRLERLRRAPAAAQDELARRLARAFAERPIGRAIGLAGVESARDLARRVAIRTYEEHVPFFERPPFWGLTTGTTGGEKAIPITAEVFRANAGAFKLAAAAALLDLRTVRPLLGKILVLGALTPLERGADGVLRGSASTIAAHVRTRGERRRVIPGTELESLPSWAEKMDALVDLCRRADVRIAAGMPPWLLSLCERAERRLGIRSVREIWPNLALAITAGTFQEPYRARLLERLGPVALRNAYAATEGSLAVQDTPEPPLLPLSDAILFEFVPADEAADPRARRFLLSEIEVGVEYAVVVSTFAGLFGYPLGDTVRFVSRDPPRLVVSGRTRQRANVAGEKVTIEEVEGAAVDAAREAGVEVAEVLLVAHAVDGRARHTWIVEARGEPSASARLAALLDGALRRRSKTYRVRREGETPAIADVEARLVPPGAFAAWLAREGRTGGQFKVPRIAAEIPAGLLETGVTTR